MKLAFIKALNSLLLLCPRSKQTFLFSSMALLTELIMVESEAYFDTKVQLTFVTFASLVIIFKEADSPRGCIVKS